MIEPDLEGHTVLVTGSAKGLGRALTLACAKRGADVAVHYHTSGDDANEIAEQARREGVEATTVRGDVTDPEAVEGLFEAIEAELGPVDVLVNNVGAFAPEHWAEMDFETWQTVMETNVTGTYLCSRRALSGMREAGWGRIVNVGYASAEKGLINPKNAPYFMAKSSVLMFTRMLAADTSEQGITANAVSPYVIENSDEFPEDLPRGRPAGFEDVIQAVFTFLEEGSGYISGTNLEVSGGWLPEDV
ncbi:3-ketoacyl-(acyl-carrier-protein) reductase [Halalkalicoccus paucihalophilus]|uniref:3-ketoacyl-(Acyl-carrier-protein) reductase n=1 Tax=Halalkalicoccus paucihalophilus TaxID=1008153 RepID=A0A151AJZ8_9EURY|nr:SDR family NAD(P)-dependent oxidoreductase [Halalkalicoccus paucihalophilus]KYH27922.1 3-ketoacyl-(acyl-carrier-protein) reductase [Halalkalicoccus paucihalophilus]